MPGTSSSRRTSRKTGSNERWADSSIGVVDGESLADLVPVSVRDRAPKGGPMVTREALRPAPERSPERPELKRELGNWMSTALVAGNMIGSAGFLRPGTRAAGVVTWGR